MRVQRVVAPRSGAVSFTVVDENFTPVSPAEAYLAHLAAIECSPNTVRAYASSLKLFFEHLETRGVAFEDVRVDDIGRFVSSLRAPAEGLIVIDMSLSRRAPSTVNRHLAAVLGLYEFQARRGLGVADELVSWRRGGRGSFKPFLDQVGGRARQAARRPVRLREGQQLPKTLTAVEIATLLEACAHLRDRFLLGLLAETGMRVGRVLGLRHFDFVSRDQTVVIVPRTDNANCARAKCRDTIEIPVSAGLVHAYSEYLFAEYGDLDSDYVFVNLFAPPRGRPMRYSAVAGLAGRLVARTGIEFNVHMLRHSFASEMKIGDVAPDASSRWSPSSSPIKTSRRRVGPTSTSASRICGPRSSEPERPSL